MQDSNTPLAFSVSDLADVLRISRSGAYAAVRNGAIDSVRVGKRIIIPATELSRLLSGRREQA